MPVLTASAILGILLAASAPLGGAPADPQPAACKEKISPELKQALAAHDQARLADWLREERKRGRSGEAARQLAASLKSDDAAVRWQAAKLLPKLDESSISALPALLDAIDDPDPMVRWAAADALRALAPKAPNAVELLLAALADDDPLVRWSALGAVRTVGPKARETVPVLVQLLNDDHAVVRREAAQALRSVLPGLPAIGMIDPADVQRALRF